MAYFVSTGACGGHSVGLRPLRGAPRLALRKPTVPPIPLRSIASPDSSLRAMRLALRAPSCAILVPLGLAVGHPARRSAPCRARRFSHTPVCSKRKNDNWSTNCHLAALRPIVRLRQRLRRPARWATHTGRETRQRRVQGCAPHPSVCSHFGNKKEGSPPP